MKLTQKINLANEIWFAMNQVQDFLPGYIVQMNLNPSLIYNDESRTKSQINRDLNEYIETYSNYITIARLLKDNLAV